MRIAHFTGKTICPTCHGDRLKPDALCVRIGGKNIAEVVSMTLWEARDFFDQLQLSEADAFIAKRLLHEIGSRLTFLDEVGLGYLTLDRLSSTLSGGESQRIKLASELAKRDTGKTVYILDEPTTGLHFKDIRVLLGILNRLVERGNTVIIIEHNLDVLKSADYIIEIGPEGGKDGGALLFEGTPEALTQVKDSPTAPFLAHELKLAKGSKKGKK